MSERSLSSFDTDVLIIGAGLSGLVAALHLLDTSSTTRVVVVEARDRVGGRTFAHEGLDLGGAWIWPPHHREMERLAARLNVATFPQYDSGWNVVERHGVANKVHEPLDGHRLRFVGGAHAIAIALADSLVKLSATVVLGVVAKEIVVNGAASTGVCVKVDTPNDDGGGGTECYTAKAVLVAVPPRVARPPILHWEPPLSSRLDTVLAATPTWMAGTTKVLLTYDRPFWREMGASGAAMSHDGPIHQLYDSSSGEFKGANGALAGGASAGGTSADGAPPQVAALCGFIFDGRQVPNDILKPRVLAQLQRCFGAMAAEPTSFTVCRWGNQPLTAGGGGAAGGGHESMGHPLLREACIGGRVWLCAAETDDDNSGLMEGAVLQGRRAAARVLASGLLS
ncbi:unnamed protein product [Phaeothamnion confervicola]